ncbi:MAG: hypothetical protein IPM52_10415 [Bacteroidetes bacterium]|nr:hypothetical protein [Bacteroidota bacterium]
MKEVVAQWLIAVNQHRLSALFRNARIGHQVVLQSEQPAKHKIEGVDQPLGDARHMDNQLWSGAQR